MDWRSRRYYTVTFALEAVEMRLQMIERIDGIKLRTYRYVPKQPDECQERGHYRYLISVPKLVADVLEFELRKADRNDGWCNWNEIKRDVSNKYYDIYGNEMPYRRCELNPYKRCNRCMDC